MPVINNLVICGIALYALMESIASFSNNPHLLAWERRKTQL